MGLRSSEQKQRPSLWVAGNVPKGAAAFQPKDIMSNIRKRREVIVGNALSQKQCEPCFTDPGCKVWKSRAKRI